MNPYTPPIAQAERRAETRTQPAEPIAVSRAVPVLPLSDVRVINVSAHGIALHTNAPVLPGERLSFSTDQDRPPILAKVLACDPVPPEDGGGFRIRCRCLLGEFDVDAHTDPAA
ncbi:MAG: PilZ domain-containing protein [Phycisphaeraceae bacterium]|nr:PilZ domain-containing protein [Phycisphaeraceae bacterium]